MGKTALQLVHDLSMAFGSLVGARELELVSGTRSAKRPDGRGMYSEGQTGMKSLRTAFWYWRRLPDYWQDKRLRKWIEAIPIAWRLARLERTSQ
jgi:hypothetical protein